MLMPDVFIGVAKTYLRQVSPTTLSQHPQGTTVAAHEVGGSAQRQEVVPSGRASPQAGLIVLNQLCCKRDVPCGVQMLVHVGSAKLR